MIIRSTDINGALRSRQRGFLLNPFRFGGEPQPEPTVGPRRYWRMEWGAPFNNSFYMRLGELELRESSGGASLPLTSGGTASANSEYYPASRAFDGSLVPNSNDYVGSTQAGWIQWDFGAGNAKEITEVLVQNTSTSNGGELDQHVRNFLISCSDDGATWVPVARKWNHPKDASASTVLPITSPIAALGHRYWRLYITANSGGSAYTALRDLELIDGGYDLTTGLVANIDNSSTNSGGNGPSKHAFDDNDSLSWVTDSGVMPVWIGLDFKIPANVTSFAMVPQTGSPERTPKDFSIQWSDDGSSWTTANSYTGETSWANFERRVFTV